MSSTKWENLDFVESFWIAFKELDLCRKLSRCVTGPFFGNEKYSKKKFVKDKEIFYRREIIFLFVEIPTQNHDVLRVVFLTYV